MIEISIFHENIIFEIKAKIANANSKVSKIKKGNTKYFRSGLYVPIKINIIAALKPIIVVKAELDKIISKSITLHFVHAVKRLSFKVFIV